MRRTPCWGSILMRARDHRRWMPWRKRPPIVHKGDSHSRADLYSQAANTYTNSSGSNSYSYAPPDSDSHSAPDAIGLSDCGAFPDPDLFNFHHDGQLEGRPLRAYLNRIAWRQGPDSRWLRQWIDGFGAGRALRCGRSSIDVDRKHDQRAGWPHRNAAEQRQGVNRGRSERVGNIFEQHRDLQSGDRQIRRDW
jgi:hypothetical protein